MMYVQCSLVNEQNHVMTTWLPKEKGIGQGAKISLKDEDGIWTITDTYGETTQEQVMLQRDLYRTHRRATDI